MVLMHSGKVHKYLKHIKEGGKYVCQVCGQKFFPSNRLKEHYLKKHTEEELKENGIASEVLQFKQKRALHKEEVKAPMNEAVPVGEDKAGAVMNQEIKCKLKDLQFKIFFINSLWSEFTHESPLG